MLRVQRQVRYVIQSDMNFMTVALSLWVEDPSAQVRMMMQWDGIRGWKEEESTFLYPSTSSWEEALSYSSLADCIGVYNDS